MFSPVQMYDLVNDITAYPQFLPWCDKSEILQQSDTQIDAALSIAKSGIRQRFATRNTLVQNSSVSMQLLEGPFKQLTGRWQFDVIGDNQGCRVTLDMNFEFSTPLLGATLNPIFTHIAGSLVDAFCRRAQDIYG